MDKIIVIIGPTGSWKTKLAVKLAKEYNGEVINADAFQVYKEISIGTSKATTKEMDGVKFHLNGDISIYDSWDIKIFQEKAKKIIAQIVKSKKIPIIVGGSNLYIDALIYNYDLSAPARDDKYESMDCPSLYELLKNKDSSIAKTVDKENKRRLVRALQIIDSGKPFRHKQEIIYDPMFVYSYIDKDILYKKINDNVDEMISNGWKAEIEKLYKKDKDISKLNAFKAIGYQEILDSILVNKKIDIDKIKQKTRQYAKRQLTWIKYHYTNPFIYTSNNYEELTKKIKLFLYS
ncbi:MAG: tRNA (adenosine(37)-N6)-dimethylallyltransferase MiaA [Mycoplasmoidaceae bacterium]|nr:MAG: tRNA (adenosine(37)-N6)-dimethylallyltransferase MiaA [Mycoplasmoidaceae bacterium]